MTRIIITFLGKSFFDKKYEYRYNEKSREGRVFPEALLGLEEFDRMLVCVTEGAKDTTWNVLEPLSLKDSRIVPIWIEDGMNDAELWRNFKAITQELELSENDEVVFDITHGFRSLPFLVFLFSAYLKVAKKVKIASVLYGVLEKKKPSDNPDIEGIVPVIQLKSFVSMLDWMSATQRFVDLGDGNGLVKLLQGLTIADASLRELVDQMAEAIEMVSDALIYIRPIEVMSAAAQLHELIPKIDIAGRTLPELQPLLLLSKQIDEKYAKLALAEPKNNSNRFKNLSRQLEIIGWYQTHRQEIKSIVLARELFVSILAYWLRKNPFNKTIRNQAQYILNQHHDMIIRNKNCQKMNDDFSIYPDKIALFEIWKQVGDPRNDYAHTGLLQNSRSIADLKAETDSIIVQSKQSLAKFLAAAKSKQGSFQAMERPPKQGGRH
jgi:CRISPR-associated DxTHG motif protein